VSQAKLFIASSTSAKINIYKLDGTYLSTIDLTALGTGMISAMTWLDNDTLLAFFDPTSTTGEKIVKITFAGDTVSAINTSWHSDSKKLSGITVPKIYSPGFSKSPIVLIARNVSFLEAISVGPSSSSATRAGNPFLSSTSNCPISINSYVTKTTDGDRMLLGSNGNNKRINIYDQNNLCLSSYDYANKFPFLAGGTIIGLAATQDTVFARLQHSTSPAIIKCAFDGITISACGMLVNDPTMLGVSSGTKELAFDAASNTLYYPNFETGSVMQANAASGHTFPLIKDANTNKVVSIAIRP
jgi:hypothetical protein